MSNDRGITCRSCTAENSNGLALCNRCQHTLSVALVNVASFYADVEKIKPGQRVRVRSAYQSTPPPALTPPSDRIADALTAAENAATTWARLLADDRSVTPPTGTVHILGWLESHVVTIATLEWCGEIVRDIREQERTLQRILDRADTGMIAGICGNEVGREVDEYGEVVPLTCPRMLYRSASTEWVRCPECGRTWAADERRQVMKAQAEDELLPVRALAKIAVALDADLSEERLTRRIEKWVEREQLVSHGVKVGEDKKPRKVYRVGDVLNLVSRQVRPRDTAA